MDEYIDNLTLRLYGRICAENVHIAKNAQYYRYSHPIDKFLVHCGDDDVFMNYYLSEKRVIIDDIEYAIEYITKKKFIKKYGALIKIFFPKCNVIKCILNSWRGSVYLVCARFSLYYNNDFIHLFALVNVDDKIIGILKSRNFVKVSDYIWVCDKI